MVRMKWGLLFSLVLVLALGTQVAEGQSSVATLTPPIAKIELSGIEPVPTGVHKGMGFGSAAGGGDFGSETSTPKKPSWRVVPPLMAYPTNPNRYYVSGSTFGACGYKSDQQPNATLVMPSGERTPVEIDGSFGCWGVALGATYGMELGDYTLIFEHPEGVLTHSWTVDYPPFHMVSHISGTDEDHKFWLLMGFDPNETLNVRLYAYGVQSKEYDDPSEQENYFVGGTDRGGYVASRIVKTDDKGAAVLDISTSRSAPFLLETVGFTLDGYTNLNGDGSPLIFDYELQKGEDSSYAKYEGFNAFSVMNVGNNTTTSIWKGLKFKDMTSPGKKTYKTSLASKGYYAVNFTWCADTPKRLQEIVEPLTVQFSIDGTVVSGWDMTRWDDGACRKWLTILQSYKDTLQIEIHYTLSAAIFDGTSHYKAGDYFQTIDASFH